MRIVEFDQVGIVGTTTSFQIRKQDITPMFDVPEDVLELGTRESMMFEHMRQSTLDTLRISPFSKDVESKRMEEISVSFFCPDSEMHPNILQIVVVAYLE